MLDKFDKEERHLTEGQTELLQLLRQRDDNSRHEKGSCGAQPCLVCWDTSLLQLFADAYLPVCLQQISP